MKFYRSDWIGIIFGLIGGCCQPFAFLIYPEMSTSNSEEYFLSIAFGLIGPVVLGLVTKFGAKGHSSIQEKVGKYINVFFMLIAYGISSGLVGAIFHITVGLPEQAKVPLAFFGSAGFGFLFAYLINPSLAYRPVEKA